MAEEIISSWETPDHLVGELVGEDAARRTWNLMRDVTEAPVPGQAMEYRVVDANGNVVAFPLQLISNTTYGVGR